MLHEYVFVSSVDTHLECFSTYERQTLEIGTQRVMLVFWNRMCLSHSTNTCVNITDILASRSVGVFRSRIMAPPLLLRALVGGLAVGGGTTEGVMADPNLRQASETTEACPRCDMIFTMLGTDPFGKRVQHIEMVERGEGVCISDRIHPFRMTPLSCTQAALGASAQVFGDTGELPRHTRIDRRSGDCESKNTFPQILNHGQQCLLHVVTSGQRSR